MEFDEDVELHNPLFTANSVPMPITRLKKSVRALLDVITALIERDSRRLAISKKRLFNHKVELLKISDEVELLWLLRADFEERGALLEKDVAVATDDNAAELDTIFNTFMEMALDLDYGSYEELERRWNDITDDLRRQERIECIRTGVDTEDEDDDEDYDQDSAEGVSQEHGEDEEIDDGEDDSSGDDHDERHGGQDVWLGDNASASYLLSRVIAIRKRDISREAAAS